MPKRKAPKSKHRTPADPAPSALDLPMLARDLDGFVYTPAGYLPAQAYRRIREDNPNAGLPRWEDIPLMQ